MKYADAETKRPHLDDKRSLIGRCHNDDGRCIIVTRNRVDAASAQTTVKTPAEVSVALCG